MYDAKEQRMLLKSSFRDVFKDQPSDKEKGIAFPPVIKPYDEDGEIYKLPMASKDTVKKDHIFDCLMDRKSQRQFVEGPISLEELSFLLWTTSRIKKVAGKGIATFRPVPSAGARHPFETYLYIKSVNGLKEGAYRYLPDQHALLWLDQDLVSDADLLEAVNGQKWILKASLIFFYAFIPYRTEWVYKTPSHKTALIDAGHLCQNLYTSCEALALGVTGVCAYNQALCDKIINVDGEDEFTLYLAPVGKIEIK